MSDACPDDKDVGRSAPATIGPGSQASRPEPDNGATTGGHTDQSVSSAQIETGGFYTSQDADLNSEVDGQVFFSLSAEKRAGLGAPRIDTHVYSRENGWAIRGLTALYDATELDVAVVGDRDDPRSVALHAAARRFPASYRRIEWWDRSEAPLPNPDVRYPELDRPAAFACANRSCSLPVFQGEQIAAAVDQLMGAGP